MNKIAKKFCKRCKAVLRNSWISLDNKNFYHPQCFTCGDCGVMLETVENTGPAKVTREDVYCYACYCHDSHRYSAPNSKRPQTIKISAKRDAYESSSSSTSTQCIHVTRNGKYDDAATLLFSSSSLQFSSHEFKQPRPLGSFHGTTNDVKPILNEKIVPTNDRTVAPKKSKPKRKVSLTYENNTSVQTDEIKLRNALGDRSLKRSRIPRPTSAQEPKKRNSSSPPLPPSKSVKALKSHPRKSSPARIAPSSFTARQTPVKQSKMHRSVSMIQTRKLEDTVHGTATKQVVSKAVKSTTSRPRSATGCPVQVEKVTFGQQKSYSVNSPEVATQTKSSVFQKRQCAATFPPKRKKGSKQGTAMEKVQSNTEEYPPIGLAVYHSQPGKTCLSQTQSSISSIDASSYSRRCIPSTQAILDAIKREGSSLIKIKQPTANPCSYDDVVQVGRDVNNNLITVASPLSSVPKWTFECPICIRSLVPVCDDIDERHDSIDSQTVYSNVVTPCGHLFHTKCIKHWLLVQGNARCPNCSSACLLESLRPVYLECNLSAPGPNRKSIREGESQLAKLEVCQCNCGEIFVTSLDPEMVSATSAALKTLRSEFEMLKTKYNAVVAENHNYVLNFNMAANLRNAYDMECRSRLQLQWENRKLLMKLEELQKSSAPEGKQVDEVL